MDMPTNHTHQGRLAGMQRSFAHSGVRLLFPFYQRLIKHKTFDSLCLALRNQLSPANLFLLDFEKKWKPTELWRDEIDCFNGKCVSSCQRRASSLWTHHQHKQPRHITGATADFKQPSADWGVHTRSKTMRAGEWEDAPQTVPATWWGTWLKAFSLSRFYSHLPRRGPTASGLSMQFTPCRAWSQEFAHLLVWDNLLRQQQEMPFIWDESLVLGALLHFHSWLIGNCSFPVGN